MGRHHNSDDSESEYKPPTRSGSRKKSTRVNATKSRTQKSKATKTSAPNTLQSHLPGSRTVRTAGNNSPNTQVGQPGNSENTQEATAHTPSIDHTDDSVSPYFINCRDRDNICAEATAPTPSIDHTDDSVSPYFISYRDRDNICAEAQLRPVFNTFDSISIGSSTPAEDPDDNVSFSFSGDSQTEGAHKFNQDQQQIDFSDCQFSNSADTSYCSTMASQLTGSSLRGPRETANQPQANEPDGTHQPQVNNVVGSDHRAQNGMNLSDNIDNWPRNVYVSLEEFITHNGTWDEMDRLYMMGVQAGIGHGITAHKNCLVAEYENVGKLWGQDVSWTSENADAGRTRAERAEIIRAVDIFERLAAIQAANDFISVRESIQAHAKELVTHHQGVHPAPHGHNHSPSQNPGLINTHAVPGNSVNNYSLPAGQSPLIPSQTANLIAMAGSQTLGGLNVSHVDGFAGALANSVMGQNKLSMTGTQQSAPNINTNRKPQGPSAPQSKAPTLTETESGRAVIKIAPFAQE